MAVDHFNLGNHDAARTEVAEALRLDPQFSLRITIEAGFNMDKERVAAKLSKVGLK